MADTQLTQNVSRGALLDPNLSSPSVAVAAVSINGGDISVLGFSESQMSLAMWELNRAGHLGGEK